MSTDHIEEDDGAQETSPLLGHDRPKSAGDVSTNEVNIDERPWSKRFASAAVAHWSKWRIVYIAGLFALIIDLGGYLAAPAQLRMLEATICRRFYATEDPGIMDVDEDIPELYCKLDPIQSELALVNGWNLACQSIIGIISAIPWGVIADKKGRRLVIVIGIVGLLLNDGWYYIVCYFYKQLPPRAILAGAIFVAIGGGSRVIASIFKAILADASPPELRATVFFLIQATVFAAQLAGPPLGILALKNLSYWPAAFIGNAVSLVSLIPIAWMPTLAMTKARHVTGGQEEINETDGESPGAQAPQDDDSDSLLKRLVSRIVYGLSEIAKILELVVTNPTLRVGMVMLFISRITVPIISFLPQYASKRFTWTIADASFVKSVDAAGSMVINLVVLPGVTKFFRTKYEISGPELDIQTLRASLPFLVLGLFLIALADTPGFFFFAITVYDFGVGYRATLDSILASAVLSSQMATLFVAISVVETMGILVFSPLMPLAFSRGLHMGAVWIGLPFMIASLICVVAAILSAFLKVKRPVIGRANGSPHDP